MDEISFAEQFTPQGPPSVNDVLARALMSDREDIVQARAEREAEEERQAIRENMQLANRAMGDPLGNLTRCQMAVAGARDRVRDLEQQLEDARQVLHRCAGEYLDWSKSAELVTATSARRSADPDMLAGAKKALAAANVERMLAAPPREPRPKRHGGFARRSDQPVFCPGCIEAGASYEESMLIHHDCDLQEEAPDQNHHADRAGGSTYSDQREITRAGVA